MRLVEAVAAIEAAIEARSRDGCIGEIEAHGCEVGDHDCVVVYAWFHGDEEPVTAIVDLADEAVTEDSCTAILTVLRSCSMPAASH